MTYDFDVPDDIRLTVSLGYAPENPPDRQICVNIYPWPYTIRVQGFESMHDAYYFAVSVCHADPFINSPDRFRRPPEPPKAETDGLPLFAEVSS